MLPYATSHAMSLILIKKTITIWHTWRGLTYLTIRCTGSQNIYTGSLIMYKSHYINPIIVQNWVRLQIISKKLFAFFLVFGIFWFQTVMILFHFLILIDNFGMMKTER